MASYGNYNSYGQAAAPAQPPSLASYAWPQSTTAGPAAVSDPYDSYGQYSWGGQSQDYSQGQGYASQGQDYSSQQNYENYSTQQWYGADSSSNTYPSTASHDYTQGSQDYSQVCLDYNHSDQSYNQGSYENPGYQSYSYSTQPSYQNGTSQANHETSAPGSYPGGVGGAQSSYGRGGGFGGRGGNELGRDGSDHGGHGKGALARDGRRGNSGVFGHTSYSGDLKVENDSFGGGDGFGIGDGGGYLGRGGGDRGRGSSSSTGFRGRGGRDLGFGVVKEELDFGGRGRGPSFGGVKEDLGFGGRGISQSFGGVKEELDFGERGRGQGFGVAREKRDVMAASFGGRGESAFGGRGRGRGEYGFGGRGSDSSFGGMGRGSDSGFGGRDRGGDSGFGGRDRGSDSGFGGGGSDLGFGGRDRGSDSGFGGRGRGSDLGFGGRGRGGDAGFGSRGSDSGFGGRGGGSDLGFGGRGIGSDSAFGGRSRGSDSGFGGRGRESSFRGRGGESGFGGRGRGGSGVGGRGGDRGRGRGGSNFGGRGSASSGRGGGDRGRGAGGRGRGGNLAGRGRGGATVRPKGSGGGGPGLGDLSHNATSRVGKLSSPAVPSTDSLHDMLSRWKTFNGSFRDCGNAITTMECSLTASKVQLIHLHFVAKELTQCHSFTVFAGSLYMNKMEPGMPGMQEIANTVFLTRGLGNTKKAAKLDCYQKFQELLTNSQVPEILSQQDCGDEALKQEVLNLYSQDPNSFKEMMRKGIEDEPATTVKRQLSERKGGPPAKRVRPPPLDPSPHSLVPKKHVDVLLSFSDPLITKLTKLKELLKEEGITKLHIVPKIDQLGNKTAIIIENVFRFASMPHPGYENRTPLFCELYMDKTFMAMGECDLNCNAAMRHAYVEFTRKICAEPIGALLQDSRRGYRWDDPDIFNVVQKKHLEDNDSLLITNLANMKQMMQTSPNLKLPIEKFVLMEFEADMVSNNSYKMLELSATRNCMLLECELVRNPDLRFTCLISMQGKIMCSRIHTTKNSAKRACSDNILKEMTGKCDIIHVGKQMQGVVHFRSNLIAAAKQYKDDGVPQLKCSLKKKETRPLLTPEDVQRIAEEVERAKGTEALPENMADRPFLPWMGRVLADLILEYHSKVTLEDFRIHINDMPKSMRDAVQVVSKKMGLKMVSKFKESSDHAVLRRPISALELTKILAVHNGTSGKFSMKQTKHPWPEEELKKYKEEYVAKYSKMYEDLINEVEDDAEPMMM